MKQANCPAEMPNQPTASGGAKPKIIPSVE